jgi:hypothetical protein
MIYVSFTGCGCQAEKSASTFAQRFCFDLMMPKFADDSGPSLTPNRRAG